MEAITNGREPIMFSYALGTKKKSAKKQLSQIKDVLATCYMQMVATDALSADSPGAQWLHSLYLEATHRLWQLER